MIEIAVLSDERWPAGTDWSAIADKAVRAAIAHSPARLLLDKSVIVEVSVKFGEDDEVQTLNAAYRGKDQPTNVLSFPMVQPDLIEGLANSDDGEVLLGDVILARATCEREAREKGVSFENHATHLVVHGTFHLLGFEHDNDVEAEELEELERDTLAALGIADPYAAVDD